MLASEQREQWDRQGFFVVENFAPAETRKRMFETILEFVRRADAGQDILPAYVVAEEALAKAERPEDRVSKVFRVHRQVPVFNEFVRQPRLVELLGGILGPDVDPGTRTPSTSPSIAGLRWGRGSRSPRRHQKTAPSGCCPRHTPSPCTTPCGTLASTRTWPTSRSSITTRRPRFRSC